MFRLVRESVSHLNLAESQMERQLEVRRLRQPQALVACWGRIWSSLMLMKLALCAVLVGVHAACGGTIRTDRDDTLYRQLGSQLDFQSVGHFEWQEGLVSFNGSGVVITDDWVLTAGHVVGGEDNAGGGITRFRFRVGSRTYAIEEWIAHPEWTSSGGSLDDGIDLGLVRLARPVLVEPATIYKGRDERGKIGTIVGFGATGTGNSGATVDSSLKRAGRNVLDKVTGDLIEIDFDNPNRRRDSTTGSNVPLELEYLPASGDSGGGLFLATDRGAELVGITSYTAAYDTEIDSDYGDIAGFVRISSHLEWIEGIVGDLDAILGDFNADKLLTAKDIDILTSEISSGIDIVSNKRFDLNGDGIVTIADRRFLIESIFKTRPGDINLDRRVDQADLKLLSESMFQFETGWSTGDFNGDGATDGSDWNIWLSNFGNVGVSSVVPEPCGGSLLLLGFIYFLPASRRRRASACHTGSRVRLNRGQKVYDENAAT